MRIEARGLTVERGGRPVVSGLSFAIEPGRALVVTGENGAGKSSLLQALAGLLPLAAGDIRAEPADETPLAERLHHVGHDNALKPSLTVRENLDFWAAALGTGRPGLAVEAALDRLGLAHALETPAGYLSTGQRRRVALARLLVAPRPLWLLDEPTAGLDAPSHRALAAMLREHLAADGLLAVATHTDLGLPATTLHLESGA